MYRPILIVILCLLLSACGSSDKQVAAGMPAQATEEKKYTVGEYLAEDFTNFGRTKGEFILADSDAAFIKARVDDYQNMAKDIFDAENSNSKGLIDSANKLKPMLRAMQIAEFPVLRKRFCQYPDEVVKKYGNNIHSSEVMNNTYVISSLSFSKKDMRHQFIDLINDDLVLLRFKYIKMVYGVETFENKIYSIASPTDDAIKAK